VRGAILRGTPGHSDGWAARFGVTIKSCDRVRGEAARGGPGRNGWCSARMPGPPVGRQ